jgi:hypothetical protein
MLEALRTLANITDYSDAELNSLLREFGPDAALYRVDEVPARAILNARKELAKVKDPGDAAVSAANIVACAEALVDVGGVGPEFLALERAIDNMRGHRKR